MYKKILLISILASLELFGAPSGVYVEVGGGLGLEDEIKTKSSDYSYDKGYIATAAVGYQADLFRFELEGRYKQDELHSLKSYPVSGDFTQESQMLNLYYSGYNQSKLISTIGLGVGVSSLKLKDVVEYNTPQEDIENKNILSYQGMFSIGYMISDSVIMTTKYTYFHVCKSDDFKSSGDNIFTLSLRYLF